MTTKKAKVQYTGSKFWLIFWTLFFFPVALALLFLKSSFHINEARYAFKYEGSAFWLSFWLVFFFPIAFLLLFLNGFSVSMTSCKHT